MVVQLYRRGNRDINNTRESICHWLAHYQLRRVIQVSKLLIFVVDIREVTFISQNMSCFEIKTTI